MHPQSVRVRRDSSERCATDRFREIEKTGQVFPSGGDAGESSNGAFIGDRSLRNAALVWSALADQLLESFEEHANGVRLACKVVVDCPHVDSLAISFGEDLDAYVDIGLDSQHEDARWVHVEITNVEGRLALEPKRTVIDSAHRDDALHGSRHTAEREITAYTKPTFAVERFQTGQHTVDGRVTPRVDSLLQLPTLERISRRQVADGERQLSGRRRTTSAIALSVELNEAFESVGGGVNRVDVRPSVEPEPRPSRQHRVTSHAPIFAGIHTTRAMQALRPREPTLKNRAIDSMRAAMKQRSC